MLIMLGHGNGSGKVGPLYINMWMDMEGNSLKYIASHNIVR